MGKKRRILRKRKFANLRKHQKYNNLVERNLTEEPEQVIPEPPIAPPAPKIVTPPTPEPQLSLDKESPVVKPTLEKEKTKTTVSSKKTSVRKKRTPRRSTKKTQ